MGHVELEAGQVEQDTVCAGMTLAEQLALIQSGGQIQVLPCSLTVLQFCMELLQLRGEQTGLGLEGQQIQDHVISIEENGRITIEKIPSGEESESSEVEEEGGSEQEGGAGRPEWWSRLSATLHSFLGSGQLVDTWLLCQAGEAVPAHQLLLARASTTLHSLLADARAAQPEEAVTLSLPDWDAATVSQFVSALYRGSLPSHPPALARLQQLSAALGVQLDTTAPASQPAPAITQQELKPSSPEVKAECGGEQQVQVVQTESGEIILLACDPNQQVLCTTKGQNVC